MNTTDAPQTHTLYMPIASPPTPAPSPGPISIPNYPYPTPGPSNVLSSLTGPLPNASFQGSSPTDDLGPLAAPPNQQNPLIRRQFLTTLLASCTPEELLFISAAIAPRLKRDFLFCLPPELALYVLTFIDDPRTLARASQVSQYWRMLVREEIVWKRMCEVHGFDDWNDINWHDSRGEYIRRRKKRRRRKEGGELALPYPKQQGPATSQEDVLLEGVEQCGDHPMDSAVEWLDERERQAMRDAKGKDTPRTLAQANSSTSSHTHGSRPSTLRQHRHSHSHHAKPNAPTSFSYRHHFVNSYITMTNWRKGGQLLRSHRIPVITPESGVVTSIALDADWVVIGLANSKIQVYSARTGVLARTLVGHELGVWAVCLVTKGGWRAPDPVSSAQPTGSRSTHSEGQRQGSTNGRPADNIAEVFPDFLSQPSSSRRTGTATQRFCDTMTTLPDDLFADLGKDGTLSSAQLSAIKGLRSGPTNPSMDGSPTSTFVGPSATSTPSPYSTTPSQPLARTPHRRYREHEPPVSLESLVPPSLRIALGLDPPDDSSDAEDGSVSDCSSCADENRGNNGNALHDSTRCRHRDGRADNDGDDHHREAASVLDEDALDAKVEPSRQGHDSKRIRSRRRAFIVDDGNEGDSFCPRAEPHDSEDTPSRSYDTASDQAGPAGGEADEKPVLGQAARRYSDMCYSSVGWGQPNSIVVSGGCDKVVMVWDVKTGRCIYRLFGHTSTIRCIRVLQNRPIAVSGSRDTTLRVWDIQRGRCLRVLEGHQQSVRCIDVCGNRVVSGSYDTKCRIWDVDTGECLHVLEGHFHQIYSVAFDGRYVASGGLDTTVRLWDAHTGECIALLQGHTALVCQLQLSPTLLITGGSDGRVITFSLSTMSICNRIAAHDCSVTSLQFVDDGNRENFLVTGGNDGRVRLYEVQTGNYIREVSEGGESVWRVVVGWGTCVVVCKRGGKTVVEIWSMRP